MKFGVPLGWDSSSMGYDNLDRQDGEDSIGGCLALADLAVLHRTDRRETR